MSRRSRVTPLAIFGLLLLSASDLLLLKIAATEAISENSTGTDKIAWNANLPGVSGALAKRRPIEAYREIVAHPVFFKSREPFVSAPPLPPVAAAPPPPTVAIDPGLALGGVMIKKEFRKAYVLSRAGPGGAWIKEGEDFMGWKVVSISSGGAKLEQAGRSIDLPLYPEQ
jgi:hypothetical protein